MMDMNPNPNAGQIVYVATTQVMYLQGVPHALPLRWLFHHKETAKQAERGANWLRVWKPGLCAGMGCRGHDGEKTEDGDAVESVPTREGDVMDLHLIVLLGIVFIAGFCIGAGTVANWAHREISKLRADDEGKNDCRLDSANHFAVVACDGGVSIIRAPIGRISKPSAINLAAWLLVLADPGGKEFCRTVEEIKRT